MFNNQAYELFDESVGAGAAAAAQTEVLTSVYDMTGYDAIEAVACLGDVTSGSVLTLTMKENTASSTSSPSPTAVTGAASSAFTAGASDADSKLIKVGATHAALSKRYVFFSLTRTAQNAVVNCILVRRYRARVQPVTVHADVIASAYAAK